MESDNKPELRMILLGKDSSEISTVGNFILGREAFDTEAPPPLKEQQSERAGGMVEGRYITLINTPHLFDPQLSEQELNQRVRECVALCSPGPHVFLLVLQPENFTMNDCITLRNVLNTYSPLSMKYSLVLTTSKAHVLFGVKGFLSVVIRECGGKHHQFTETIQYNKYQVIQLLEKIDEVVSMNAGNHLICEKNESFEEALREGKLLVKPGQTCFAEKDGNRGGRKQSVRKTPKQKVCEELRMVLLGKNSSAIGRVGNFILDRDVFNTEAPPTSVEKHSVRAAGMVDGRYITLINTPQLFHPQVSLFQITVQIKECMILCSPGPHVLVLVLQPDDFTERDRHRLNYILRTLSEDAYKHTLILIKQKQQSGSCEHPVHPSLFEEHSNRIIKLECSRSDLVDMIKRMVDLNGGRHLEWEEYEEAPPASEQQQHRQMPTQSEIMDKPSPLKLSQRLNLVLCGSNRVMKSSISDLILGQRELRPDSSSVCVRREAEVCGRLISLVELPALYNTYFSEKKVRQETLRCVIHCDPGIHAFLLILPEGHLADEDKGELEMLQRIFGSTLNSYIIFLINTESLQEGMEIDKETKTFTETYRGGYYTFGHVPDVSGLMERVQELLLENNGDVYTPLVFLDEQIGTQIRRYKDEVSEMKKTIQTLQRKAESQDALKISRRSADEHKLKQEMERKKEELESVRKSIEEKSKAKDLQLTQKMEELESLRKSADEKCKETDLQLIEKMEELESVRKSAEEKSKEKELQLIEKMEELESVRKSAEEKCKEKDLQLIEKIEELESVRKNTEEKSKEKELQLIEKMEELERMRRSSEEKCKEKDLQLIEKMEELESVRKSA